MNRWRPESLTSSCRRGLKWLSGLPWQKDFYFAGGSALALRLGHRLSVDLDFFSDKNRLGDSERKKVLADLPASKFWNPIEEEEGFVRGNLFSVSASWFYYPYPLLKLADVWEGIRVASLHDIGVMKLSAIAQRGIRRDFVDLWCICQKIPLEDLLTAASEKFAAREDYDAVLLRALSYFEDAEAQAMLRLRQPVRWETIRAFFESEVRRLTLRRLRRKEPRFRKKQS